ncbi:hypothetical protein E2C01_060955 [Portunus trituberculatus]|uniref:Uncharacterized protein n=1 Tax=Portunus trituberculatus TaxID=210409 RepID=A0A5B7H2K6_PORTR|nr:hypothetical protein [Portunus trituberculatus]
MAKLTPQHHSVSEKKKRGQFSKATEMASQVIVGLDKGRAFKTHLCILTRATPRHRGRRGGLLHTNDHSCDSVNCRSHAKPHSLRSHACSTNSLSSPQITRRPCSGRVTAAASTWDGARESRRLPPREGQSHLGEGHMWASDWLRFIQCLLNCLSKC